MKPLLFKHSVTTNTLIFCIFFLFSARIFAQAPVNDNCAGATTLVSAIACTNTPGTLINATRSTLVSFSTPGVNFWTCPIGVTSVVVECWGAGGAGGGAANANTAGGGGGGGAYRTTTVAVIPGTTYLVNVGLGSPGTTGSGVSGTASTFNIASVVANGGNGGVGGTTLTPNGAGGAGATGGSFNGGNGAAAAGLNSGAGGGGAGTSAAGGNAIGITAGVGGVTVGGNGGAGNTAINNGATGLTYGGGGSGGKVGGTGTRIGGKGADGFVRLTYGICGNANSPDVWYRFVATSAYPTITLSSIGANLNTAVPRIQLFDACGGGILGCSVNPFIVSSTYPTGLIIGNTYFIQVTTNSSFGPVGSGSYGFNICVTDPPFEFSKSYTNITDRLTGGTINIGDTLEIRTTIVVRPGTPGGVFNLAYYDTLKAGKGFAYVSNSISTRTNEGKIYNSFTDAVDADAGWFQSLGLDTSIQINMGGGATRTVKDTLFNTSFPRFSSNCIIVATYRVRVNAAYGTKINFGGGAIEYSLTAAGVINKIPFPSDSLIVYESLGSCPDATSPTNVVGSEFNGSFGAPTTGASAAGTQNRVAPVASTTYIKTDLNSGAPQDYYYSIVNNTSGTNSIIQTAPKSNTGGVPSRVFSLFDITGDHTNATNLSKGNKPCDPTLPVSATNPCGYMLVINASYKPDVIFDYTVTGGCSETYYEISAWFKNVCIKCGADSMGRGPQTASYIPTGPGDSSGVRPNVAMRIDGINYYTTGEIVYKGLGGTQTGSDTLNEWVKRSFVFKTRPSQTSFNVTFVNNAPGGGGNDWAIDDIGIRTCYPTMIYAPPNPIVFMGNSLTITDTVRSYYSNYRFYKWQVKPVSGSWTDLAGFSGIATPILINGNYEYTQSYTIPGTATLAANAGDLYRMVVATSANNLINGCNYTPDLSFTILPTDAPCAFTDTNYAIAPQTGNIDWNKLDWSLGHVPTCCESAQITYTGTNTSPDALTVDITNDICIINLTLINNSNRPNQLFKTILHPGFNMQMNGNVRMGAPATAATDSCIFMARGGGTITVNGNTVIGYPSDLSTSIIGTAPGTATYANYLLRGDSLAFNTRAFTNHKFTSVTLDPTTGAAVLVNNTNALTYPTAVTFDRLKIGNTSAKTVTASGSTQNSFMNDNSGNLEVTAGSTLILPANYSINAKDFVTPGTYVNDFFLRANATLSLGGTTGGITGSNFPANFINYSVDATSTVIFNGAAQTIPGSLAKFAAYGNLTLSGTGIKTASASNINIAGNFYRRNGGHTFNANGGRITFTSAASGQRYYTDAGATPINFYDFTNNNTHSSGLLIDSTMGILNELELRPSTTITLNTGDIIMRSLAGNTSHITNLGTTIPSIVYNSTYRFVVERHLFAQKAWRFLATPVLLNAADVTTPTVAASWRESQSALSSAGYGTAVTGPTGPSYGPANQMDYYTQRGSMKFYNDAANLWSELTNTTTTRIANTQGYMVFVRGDRGAPNTTAGAGTVTNLRIKGKIRTGDQAFGVLANKFQSIGNPYASQINFLNVGKVNITNSFIVWKPGSFGLYGVGGYENYSIVGSNYRLNGLAGGAIRNTIESGEAFFVQNNSASAGTVTIRESDKGIGSSLVSRTSNNGVVVPTIDISLFEKDAADSFVLVDGASTSFDNSFSNDFDNDDVVKFTNSTDNLFIKSNNKNLVVERRSMLTALDTIKLGITGTRTAAYRFKVDPYRLDNFDLQAFLADKYNNTETAFSLLDSTFVNFDITADAASKAADRFMIIFKPLMPLKAVNITAERNGDRTVTVNWSVAEEKSMSNYIVEQSDDAHNFKPIADQLALANNGTDITYNKIDGSASKATNWYRIKATSKSGALSYSAIAVVNEIGESKIAINPNPVEGGKINLYLQYQPSGTCTIQISNKAGQVVKVEKINVLNINELRTIGFNGAAGTYQMKVTSSEGTSSSLSFMVK